VKGSGDRVICKAENIQAIIAFSRATIAFNVN